MVESILAKALAEVARLKEKLAKQKDAVSDVAGEKEERLLKQEKEIRLLERQRVSDVNTRAVAVHVVGD